MHYLITGGTGFIGSALSAALLKDRHTVTVLTRSVTAAQKRLALGAQSVEHLNLVRGVDVVVNLAGEPLAAGRWTPARKQAFQASRIGLTRQLLGWIESSPRRPRVLVSGSAIGFYGSRGSELLDERSAPGADFASRLCQDWEAAALDARALGLRVCLLRTGIVLGADGGALARMLPPFRLGLGGRMGSGEQWMSWVHRDDLVAMIRWLAETDAAEGAYNGTAPAPRTNAEFVRALGARLHRPTVLASPAFVLKGILGEMAELLLGSQRVLPARAAAAGFRFRYPALEAALEQLV